MIPQKIKNWQIFTWDACIPTKNYKYFKKSNYKEIFLLAWDHKKEIFQKEKLQLKNMRDGSLTSKLKKILVTGSSSRFCKFLKKRSSIFQCTTFTKKNNSILLIKNKWKDSSKIKKLYASYTYSWIIKTNDYA